MHIALNGWFWDQPHTGSGQYLRQLLRTLPQVAPDLEWTLIMPPHNPEPTDVPAAVAVLASGHSTQTSKWGKVWFEQRTFPRLVGRSGADLAHVPYWGPPLAASVPVVASVLDVIPLLYPVYASGWANRLYTSLVTSAARGADHILTLSETSKLDIETLLHIPGERITVTYLAADDRFHPQLGTEHDEAVRAKYDLPEQFVLYLGGFDARKQVNELLLAYTYVGEAEGDNIPLVLAGRQPDWTQALFPDLPSYIERLNIGDYVRWIGYVDEADKPALLRLADVYVWPSEYEGFGLPPLEAMASGTPVVAWDSVVADEVLEAGAYLVESARDMAGAIIALLLQKPLRDTMINQGIAQASNYSWRKTALTTLRTYEAVLRSSTGA